MHFERLWSVRHMLAIKAAVVGRAFQVSAFVVLAGLKRKYGSVCVKNCSELDL